MHSAHQQMTTLIMIKWHVQSHSQNIIQCQTFNCSFLKSKDQQHPIRVHRRRPLCHHHTLAFTTSFLTTWPLSVFSSWLSSLCCHFTALVRSKLVENFWLHHFLIWETCLSLSFPQEPHGQNTGCLHSWNLTTLPFPQVTTFTLHLPPHKLPKLLPSLEDMHAIWRLLTYIVVISSKIKVHGHAHHPSHHLYFLL